MQNSSISVRLKCYHAIKSVNAEHHVPGPEEVEGDEDEGADDCLGVAPRADADHQRVVEPRHRRHSSLRLYSPPRSQGGPERILGNNSIDNISTRTY